METKSLRLALFALLIAGILWAWAGALHASDQHSKHMAEMNERGNRVMGFDQEKATHHFRLLNDGGIIEVTANDPNDIMSRDQIRRHLEEIANAFSEGRFEAPVEIHEQAPPGATVMDDLKSTIGYRFEPTERGGRVRITTNNPTALKAVHDFLRFQIDEHQTGDPLSVVSK